MILNILLVVFIAGLVKLATSKIDTMIWQSFTSPDKRLTLAPARTVKIQVRKKLFDAMNAEFKTDFKPKSMNKAYHFVVFKDGETVIGGCAIHLVRQTPMVGYGVVFEEHRGKGYSKQIFDVLNTAFSAWGYKKYTCMCTGNLVQFYKNLGTEVSDTPDRAGRHVVTVYV